jgi:uncharacterized phage-associated protein
MTLSAHDVAAVLRGRLPGLAKKKLHKLLYYCQGHHLAAFDEPLFTETIAAFDMGPVVPLLWREEKSGDLPPLRTDLDESQLNTIGYVISRYGALTGRDLENMSHNESPWQIANSNRRPGQSVRIEPAWIRDYFKTNGVADSDDDELSLDSVAVSDLLKDATARLAEPSRPDSIEELRARLTPSAR